MFKKFSEKAGFTQTEIKVIFFLLIILLIGGVAKTVTQSKENFDYNNFSYTKDDSLFISESPGNKSIKAFETSDSLNRSNVLDFKNQSFFNAERKAIPKEKSVNLNKSGVEELTKIPGIGKIIAKNIIELRNQRGKFLNLEELLDVKRIGDKKFNKIKRYIYIE